MLKKLVSLVLVVVLLSVSTFSSVFALEIPSNEKAIKSIEENSSTYNVTNIDSKTAKPMIDEWVYQMNTPIVGTESNYNIHAGITNKNFTLSTWLKNIGINTLSSVLAEYLPNPVTRLVASAIISAIQNCPYGNTPSLYCHENVWYYGSSLNKEVIDEWYADAAHTQYICTTKYFASFL
ncbi:hypothetical protein CE561_08050 [Thermoanaerobacterium thermosaccharolyticum]|uniref:Uncharacterized protein n=1 Tax=Thermoanaerobacterium thermosaccharolyticum TaxID=1517 RepID=A0A231VGL2_THETR|nr:hypothetical protein [Thermoanaerobacterium thermosaccharolyticum]OXT07312.1 hypothetical protein CE561_08050 [Thermoanaerobacterium thermosaccharolyticum]